MISVLSPLAEVRAVCVRAACACSLTNNTLLQDAIGVLLDWQYNSYLSKGLPQEFTDEFNGIQVWGLGAGWPWAGGSRSCVSTWGAGVSPWELVFQSARPVCCGAVLLCKPCCVCVCAVRALFAFGAAPCAPPCALCACQDAATDMRMPEVSTYIRRAVTLAAIATGDVTKDLEYLLLHELFAGMSSDTARAVIADATAALKPMGRVRAYCAYVCVSL
jgi:hypothetical protein